MEPIVGEACGYAQRYRTEPIPASAEPTAKVKEMVLFRLMPISSAAPMSSETARMAFPRRVRCTRNVSAAIASSVTTMVRIAA